MDIQAFLSDPTGIALKGVLLLAFIDFIFGVFAALRDGTFALDAVGAFIRKHLLGRVFPIGVALVAGYYSGEPLLTIPGLAAAAIYVAETAASVKGSLLPPAATEEVEEENPAVTINPIPTD
jgi:hypothetical protein